jgi:hypothetical protein
MRLKLAALVIVLAASGILLLWGPPSPSGGSGLVKGNSDSPATPRPELSIPLHSPAPADERNAIIEASSRQAPEQGSKPWFELRFRDDLNQVVSGVGVWQRSLFESTDEYSFCGRSTDEGLLRVESAAEPSEKAFRFLHADFSDRGETIAVESGSGVTIVLDRGVAIHGVALDSSGSRLRARPWVLAHREGEQPSKRQVYGKLRGEEEPIHLVRVAEDGSFSIRGLEQGGQYVLVLGGSGFAVAKPFGPLQPGPDTVTVPVDRTYGAFIRLVDASTSNPLASPLQWRIGGLQYFWTHQGQFECLGWDSLQAVLMGLPVESLRATPTSTSLALFVGQANSSEVDEIGPIRCIGQVLGSEPLDARASLPRIREILQTIDLDVHLLGGQVDDLEIRWMLPPDYVSRRPGLTDGEVAHVRLRDLADDSTYTLPLTDRDLTEGGCIWPDVPHGGAYMAWFSFDGSTHYVGRASGNVPFALASGGRTIEFDLSELQTLEFKLTSRTGEPIEGGAVFEISRFTGDDLKSDFVAFQRGPYRIDGLQRARYGVCVYAPFYLDQGPVDLSGVAATSSTHQVEIRQP